MYVIVRCRSAAALARVQDDLKERGIDLFGLGEQSDPTDVAFQPIDRFSHFLPRNAQFEQPGTSSAQDGQTAPDAYSTDLFVKEEEVEGELWPVKEEEEEGAISALDLLGSAEDEDCTAASIFDEVEDKPEAGFERAAEEFMEPPREHITRHGLFQIECQTCKQRLTCSDKTIWGEKSGHVLDHLPICFECPHCHKQEAQRFNLTKHLQQCHNGNVDLLTLPAIQEQKTVRMFLLKLDECFPRTKPECLDLPGTYDGYDESYFEEGHVHSSMYYYARFDEACGRARRSDAAAPPSKRQKCSRCGIIVGGGWMAEKLMFAHAITHSGVPWVRCSRCPSINFLDHASFHVHNRQLHQGSAKLLEKKDRVELKPVEQAEVDELVVELFSTPREEVVKYVKLPAKRTAPLRVHLSKRSKRAL